jgi:hypothetical protein
MLELFPELRHTTNIVFTEASKKSNRRFRRNNFSPEQLDRPMWAHAFLTDRVHEHVREVADVSLRKVPFLSMKLFALDQRDKERAECARRRQQIVMASRKVPHDRWPEYRVHLMRQLLAGEVTVKFNAATSSRQLAFSGPPVSPRSSQRRHTLGGPIAVPKPTDSYKLRAMEFMAQKRASVAGSSMNGEDDPDLFSSFSSFHSATERLDDDDVGLSIDANGFLI